MKKINQGERIARATSETLGWSRHLACIRDLRRDTALLVYSTSSPSWKMLAFSKDSYSKFIIFLGTTFILQGRYES